MAAPGQAKDAQSEPMSALQQVGFCGLEKPGFPYPADACQRPQAVP
jgi:hypothetical protein